MAKKARPRLVMADNIPVTDIQSLKDHFDWEKALHYYKTGELIKWLRRLYLDEEADALEKLDSRSADFPKAFCAIFGVEYTGADFDFGEAFGSDLAEETFVEEEPSAALTAENLPEITEASLMPLAEPSESVPAMPPPPSEPPTDATPTDSPQNSSPNNSSGLGAFVGCFLMIVTIIGIAGILWSFISSLWSSFNSKEANTEPPMKIEQQQQKKQPVSVVVEELYVANIKAFCAYHENNTKRNFQQAYAFFDKERKDDFAS